jgi:hypothetical protein
MFRCVVVGVGNARGQGVHTNNPQVHYKYTNTPLANLYPIGERTENKFF